MRLVRFSLHTTACLQTLIEHVIAICIQACGVRFQNGTFAVSKRTFAVSERNVFARHMSCLGDEINMFSWLKRNVWLLYTIFTI